MCHTEFEVKENVVILKHASDKVKYFAFILGPTAVVQFNIWERGDIDIHQVTDKLLSAMKHAVCDIVMEYRLLTAPLCEVPQHYTKGQESPMHSAPPSPIVGAGMYFLVLLVLFYPYQENIMKGIEAVLYCSMVSFVL